MQAPKQCVSIHVVICYQSQHKKTWRGLEREREGAGGELKYLHPKRGLIREKAFFESIICYHNVVKRCSLCLENQCLEIVMIRAIQFDSSLQEKQSDTKLRKG